MIEVMLQTTANGRAQEQVGQAKLTELLSSPDNLVWFDLADPMEEEIVQLGEEFGFHELSLEDVHRANQRPKLDEYPTYCFLVLYTARFERPDLVLTDLKV